MADRKMEGHCSTGQSPQRAVVPMEEEQEQEQEEEKKKNKTEFCCLAVDVGLHS